MRTSGRLPVFLIIAVLFIIAIAWVAVVRIQSPDGKGKIGRQKLPVPVETAPITTGPITLKRHFSGTLEAVAEFIVAPKVSGRVERIHVDISDTVSQGQLVAELDNAEYIQQLTQAKADLAVAEANLAEAENALVIANRELDRILTLKKRGIKSESQLDTAKTNQLEKQASLEVAKAQVIRARSAVESANIRLGYTKVTAAWSGEDASRTVAERFVDEGDTVSANTPLMTIVRLHPITGVIYITEKDYARLKTGQTAFLSTDAFEGKTFSGHIARIAPVFKKETRQARIEIEIDNAAHLLKPGMFIRATIILDHREDAVIVPEQAVTRRDDETGVFVVSKDHRTVAWTPVQAYISEAGNMAVTGLAGQGEIVILGQQMLTNGSEILMPEKENVSPPPHSAGEAP